MVAETPSPSASPASFHTSRSNSEVENEQDILHRKLMLFGTNVGDIPCFRNSFLYGIGGGIGIGIAHFAISSRIQSATKFGFWSYVGITLAYWCHCRYDYTITKQEYTRLQYALKHAAQAEGTKNALPRTTSSDNST